MESCPCGSGNPFAECCERYISGALKAVTPEALLRSRYTAYVKKLPEYIVSTTHPDQREGDGTGSVEKWMKNSEWHWLEILESPEPAEADTGATVEFKAGYTERGRKWVHHEVAEFRKEADTWYFFDARMPKIVQYKRPEPKTGRNQPCPCGSGKKFKRCCGM